MAKTYIMTVAHTGVQLYGGHQDSNNSYTAFKEATLDTVEKFCAQDIPAADKMATKLGVVFSAAYSESEKETVVGQLRQNGYSDVREFDLNASLCDYIKGYPYALILSADADTLFAAYYSKAGNKCEASTSLEGAGTDPRVEVLANCIWKKLIAESGYLSKEKDFEEVKQEARRFLQSGKAELDGNIHLEGEDHDFFVRRRDAAIDNVLDYGGYRILSELRNFADRQGLEKDNTILVLAPPLAGNGYFHDVFCGFMADMEEVDEATMLAVVSVMQNRLNEVKTLVSSVGGALPPSYISEHVGDDQISFDLTFPQGAYAIEVTRDGNPVRTLTEPSFQDKGLSQERTYEYGFVVVYKNEAGEEIRTRPTLIKVTTSSLRMPQPSSIQIQESAAEAVLTWSEAERGSVKIYYSTQPFQLHTNDIIDDVNGLEYPTLQALGTTYQLQKDFSGERFFVPVTVVGNKGIAGEQRCVVSILAPKGVRVDATDASHVKVLWLWEGVSVIRIRWSAEGGNENWKDIVNEGQLPELELPLPTQLHHFTVSISSIYQTAGKQVLESAVYTQEIVLASAKVNFVEARSESRFFLYKDEYSLTLQADREPPCDLYVLIGEGMIPLDLTNFKSYLTIPRQELAGGSPKKFTLSYQRQQKKQPLYFRIVPADRKLPLKVVPETQKIK